MTRAAVTQICSTPDINKNLACAQRIISRAAKAGASLIYLPEAADFVARSADIYKLTHSKENANYLKGIQSQAKEHKVFIGVGVHEPNPEDKERVYNTQHLINDKGEIIASYRKTHMFDVSSQGMMESKSTIPGDKIEDPSSTPVGNVGMLTCYDMRFAEPALQLRRKGAQVLCYPSAFTPITGPPHWDVLLRARAIETQTYVLASAQIGQHYPQYVNEEREVVPGRQSYGYAHIIDPWGTIIASAGSSSDHETYAIAEVDLDFLERCRKDMPLWEQRRTPDLYPEI